MGPRVRRRRPSRPTAAKVATVGVTDWRAFARRGARGHDRPTGWCVWAALPPALPPVGAGVRTRVLAPRATRGGLGEERNYVFRRGPHPPPKTVPGADSPRITRGGSLSDQSHPRFGTRPVLGFLESFLSNGATSSPHTDLHILSLGRQAVNRQQLTSVQARKRGGQSFGPALTRQRSGPRTDVKSTSVSTDKNSSSWRRTSNNLSGGVRIIY